MVIVYNIDKHKYIGKHRKIENIRYSNGVRKVYKGEAIYLAKRVYNENGLVRDIINFILKHKNKISNIISIASSDVDSVGKVG